MRTLNTRLFTLEPLLPEHAAGMYRVLCDPALYDGAAPPACKQMLHYLRIRAPILLVADRPELLGGIMAQAVAEISCTYNDVQPCFDRALIDAVEASAGGERSRRQLTP